jgi:PKD repeat protein
MKTPYSLLLAAIFLTTAFAGCSSEDETLKAAFVATNVDAEKTMFKFDASSSTGKDLKFSWDFGDRTEAKTGETIDHAYEYPNGAYQVTLTVTDSAGAEKKITQPVVTGNGQNEGPLLYLSADKRRAMPEEEIFFDGSQSVDPDGDPIFFEWDFNAQIDNQTLADMENLGWQAYGRFPANKPPPANSGGGNGSMEQGGETLLTPSGHDLDKEIEKARTRLYERLGWDTLHGGEAGAAEPRNTAFNGKIDDTSPVQFYKFPSTAVYYVHVRVEDIKGDGQEGFLKISVEDSPPATSNSTPLKGQLKPAPLQPLQGVVPGRDAQTFSVWSFRYELPGTSSAKLTYTNEGDQGDKLVALYVCASASFADCTASPKAKLDKGASGRTLTWVVGPGETLPFTYYVMVSNEGNAVVNFEFPVETQFDTNPWAKDEAGFGGAHH